MIGLVAVTAAGRQAAGQLAAGWPDARRYDGPASAALPRAFADCDGIVCFLSVGAVVRIIAPLLRGKDRDPGVVCVDEGLQYAIPVAGGHASGANELARRLAETIGAQLVITTASDASGSVALDEFGADLGFAVEPGSDLAAVGAALLSGGPVTLTLDCGQAGQWPVPPLPPNVAPAPAPESGVPAIIISDRVTSADDGAVRPRVTYRPPSLAVGAGASRGVSAAEAGALIDSALARAGLSPRSVRVLATADLKAAEAGLVQAARERGWQLVTYPAAELARVPVPHPSEAVRRAAGTPSVAEAAALLAAGSPPAAAVTVSAELAPAAGPAGPAPAADLVVPKQASAHATVAVARTRPRGRLALVGIGPGARDLMTPRAAAELRRASVVVGLDQYLDQVRDLLRPGTRVLSSGLGSERERAAAAVAEAAAGRAVALVSSGDAGVYAMASPALETAGAGIDVAGVPGVTAALAAAAVLGAPLGHDHAVISLSDLLTPWAAIEQRVAAAAAADLVICLYNPASRERTWQLGRAMTVIAKHRQPGTPVGWVRNASRAGQQAGICALAMFEPGVADMSTIVVVGSSRTRVVCGRMVTPRGYGTEPQR